MTVYPLFKDDERCTDILANPGSGPLGLFWNIVNAMDQRPESKIQITQGAVGGYNEKHKPSGGMDNMAGPLRSGLGSRRLRMNSWMSSRPTRMNKLER